ncbi:MAG TPA: four helix bundle protein [Thermoanaerobaculia bacterium]|nr:four helix bundle protein [Thermoanaerobaculia bacterium]
MRNYRESTAYQLARSLLVHAYDVTRPAASSAADPVRELRRAAIAVAANLVQGSASRAREERLGHLNAALEALRAFAVQANLCQLRGHLPTAAAGTLLTEQAAATAALQAEIHAARALAS